MKLHISHALGDRTTRVACLTVEAITGTLDLLGAQPSAVIEGLIDYAKHTRPPRGREDFNVALIKYGEYAMEQARVRDRRLLSGITGEPAKNDGLVDFKPEPGSAGLFHLMEPINEHCRFRPQIPTRSLRQPSERREGRGACSVLCS